MELDTRTQAAELLADPRVHALLLRPLCMCPVIWEMRKILHQERIFTLGDLMARTEEDIEGMSGIGEARMGKIRRFAHGYFPHVPFGLPIEHTFVLTPNS